MNQKDYKEIAGIIKEQKTSYTTKSQLANKLADYFEREDKRELKRLKLTPKDIEFKNFNRQQFKEWCGTEK